MRHSIHLHLCIVVLLLLAIGCAPTVTLLSWRSAEGPSGQNITTVLADTHNPSTIYAALATGELMMSTDRGTTWERRSAFPGNATAHQLTIHPEEEGTIFAATTSGLIRSTDSGATWSPVPILSDGTPSPEVRALTIDPWDPGIVYAGVDGSGIWYSGDGGQTWRQRNGDLSPMVASAGNVRQIIVHPADPDILFALFSVPGLVRSTDAGETWDILTDRFAAGGTSLANMAIHPANPSILLIGTNGGDIYRSENGGSDWRLSFQGSGYAPVLSFSLLPGHRDQLIAATAEGVISSLDFGTTWEQSRWGYPHGAGTLIAVADSFGVALYLYGQGTGMMMSADSGSSWREIDKNLGGSDITQVLPSRSGDAVFAVVGKGVYRYSSDSGWTSASKGLPGTTVAGLAFNGEAKARLYAATGSGPYVLTSDGDEWEPLGTTMRGTGFDLIAAHPAIPNRIFGETGNGLVVSTDRGLSWNRTKPSLRGYSIRSVTFHPSNAGLVCLATAHHAAITSDDGGISWDETPYGIDADTIVAVTFSLEQRNRYFAWSADGRAYRSTNNGIEWTSFESPWGTPQNLQIAFDHFQPSSVIALVGDRTLFRSSDGGESWVSIETQHVPGPVTAVGWNEKTATFYAGVKDEGLFLIPVGKPDKKKKQK